MNTEGFTTRKHENNQKKPRF